MSGSGAVSVIIPTFNRAHVLVEAIASVLGQTVQPLEVLVVDDGSTDDTPLRCGELPSPVRYLRQQNAGVSSARNRGIREAQGEFVAFLDSDDMWEPNFLEVQLAALATNPSLGWSIANATTVAMHGKPIEGTQGFARNFPVIRSEGADAQAFFGRWLVPDHVLVAGTSHAMFTGDLFGPLLLGNFVSPCGTVIRRHILDSVGGFDESLRVAEDTEFFHRVASQANAAVVLTPLFRWRVGHESLVASKNTVALIEGGLTSLMRARALRGHLQPKEEEAFATGRRRLLLELAYAHLSNLELREARARSIEARRAGAAFVSVQPIYLATAMPPKALKLLHLIKRRLRDASRALGIVRPSR